MDSRNQCNQYSGYVNLLSSQEQNVGEGNFPYESFPSTVSFGASQIPLFSSQQSEAPSQPDDIVVERRERRKWTPFDDELLISAWLNTSKDAVVGNDQKSLTFWKRVAEYYGESAEARPHQHCKSRWHKINEHTNKFCGAFALAERQQSSGQNDNDVLKAARDIYYNDHNTRFTLEHCWCLLRFEQKWCSLNTLKSTESSKRKACEAGSQSSNTNVPEPEIRPEGIKAAKARRAKGKSIEDYKTMWGLKQEDLVKKEKLSKLAILDTLLTKKEPLSEAEETAKNKILAEFF